jgi:hypothetical protein
MTEKRRAHRVPLDIYVNKYVSGVPYLARASDISPEGVSLSHLLEPHIAGKRVGLQFQLPGAEEVIYAEGEVVREWVDARAEGSGIRFTLITDRHRQLIGRWIDSHSSG